MTDKSSMPLGNFSVSLAVKDLEASRIFYDKLGFRVINGDTKQNWLILQNGQRHDRALSGHVRTEHVYLQSRGGTAQETHSHSSRMYASCSDDWCKLAITPVTPVDNQSDSGPANFLVVDPDGNPILIDQHV